MAATTSRAVGRFSCAPATCPLIATAARANLARATEFRPIRRRSDPRITSSPGTVLCLSLLCALCVSALRFLFFSRVFRPFRRPTLLKLPFHPVEPPQFYFELLDHQAHHPNRFVIRMPYLLQNRPQHFLLLRNFFFQKLPAPRNLPFHHARPRSPGKRHPSQKGWPIPLRRPILSFESIRQRRFTLLRCLKTATFRPRSGLPRFQRTNHPRPRQFLQRVIDLRSGNPRPIFYLAPHQFCIGLIPMHRSFRQQAQKHQVRRSEPQFLLRHNCSLQCLRAPLRTLCLCVIFVLFLSLSLLLYVLTSFLPLPAPPPPLALLRHQPRILRLCHRRAEYIQHANILMLPRHASQFLVHPLRILLRQLSHASDTQQLEVPQHRRSDGNQIPEFPHF